MQQRIQMICKKRKAKALLNGDETMPLGCQSLGAEPEARSTVRLTIQEARGFSVPRAFSFCVYYSRRTQHSRGTQHRFLAIRVALNIRVTLKSLSNICNSRCTQHSRRTQLVAF
jgi:hypothetical protein